MKLTFLQQKYQVLKKNLSDVSLNKVLYTNQQPQTRVKEKLRLSSNHFIYKTKCKRALFSRHYLPSFDFLQQLAFPLFSLAVCSPLISLHLYCVQGRYSSAVYAGVRMSVIRMCQCCLNSCWMSVFLVSLLLDPQLSFSHEERLTLSRLTGKSSQIWRSQVR